MKRPFWKMHGIGNDYVYFDCFTHPFPITKELAVKLCDRHFSVGGDGVVLILPSSCADAQMRMFNADGSEGEMCGNAIRCVGKYLYGKRGLKRETLTVETRAGVKTLSLHTKGDEVVLITVDMGSPVFSAEAIPARFPQSPVVSQPLTVGEETYLVTCLSMGNPHCVVFCDDPYAIDLPVLGTMFETHPAFPNRVNAEFVHAEGNRLQMRVWERGSGETLACGTGACAAAVAAVLNGKCRMGCDIEVSLRGGKLTVRYTGETVFLTGQAEFAFEGAVFLPDNENEQMREVAII